MPTTGPRTLTEAELAAASGAGGTLIPVKIKHNA